MTEIDFLNGWPTDAVLAVFSLASAIYFFKTSQTKWGTFTTMLAIGFCSTAAERWNRDAFPSIIAQIPALIVAIFCIWYTTRIISYLWKQQRRGILALLIISALVLLRAGYGASQEPGFPSHLLEPITLFTSVAIISWLGTAICGAIVWSVEKFELRSAKIHSQEPPTA